ncbi:hypothetical protein AQJ23_16405 [Streptomyces antibioticus]|nr:hypothetical protein [Streptomyces antibioticus]KUN25463.1 hypothetical protein AQJ23_16405 [Streptomyces antibioticus]
MREQNDQKEQGSSRVREVLVARADEAFVPDGWADRVLGGGRRAVGRRRLAATAAAVAAVVAVVVAVSLSGLSASDAQPPASSRPKWAVQESVPRELRNLPVGPGTRLPYGTGGDHEGSARQVVLAGKAVPVPDKHGGLRIWQAGKRGFVYLAQESKSVTVVVYVDADGSKKELERTGDGQHTTQLNVSADGRFAAWTVHPTEGRSVVVKRADLSTGKVDSRTYEGIDSVYGFAGDDVLVEWNGRIHNIGSLEGDRTPWPSAALSKHPAGVSIAADSVLLRVSNGCLRSYAISQPQEQRWELCDETGQMRFSPDGRWIAGERGDGSLVVHDASSGDVTAQLWSASRVHVQGMAWESDNTLLLGLAEQELPSGSGTSVPLNALRYGPTYLVRCEVEQERCELVDTGGPVTVFPSSVS